MWWADRFLPRAGLAAAVLLAVGACQVRPLYSPAATGAPLEAELAQVLVKPAKGGRVMQLVRNDLVFMLNGGGQEGAAYELQLDGASNDSASTVRQETGELRSQVLNLRASYRLRRRGDPQVLLSGSVTRQATYQDTTQRFANDRAVNDAQKRAAREAAEEIRLRLSIYFATGHGKVGDQSSPELIDLEPVSDRERLSKSLGAPE